MPPPDSDRLAQLLALLFQAHPWHGVTPAPAADGALTGYIEIVATDTVKYELDKPSGVLRVDRPNRFSSQCPTPYGFVPQSYCAELIAERCMARTGLKGIVGDGDPLDLCILTEKSFTHGSFLLRCRPIGGLRMIDSDEADDKIIAVLEGDAVYGHMTDLTDAPAGVVDRLRHFFLTYKQGPAAVEAASRPDVRRSVEIAEIYGRDEAIATINASYANYRRHFGEPSSRLAELRQLLASG